MTELLMSGFDRTYLPPRSIRRTVMPETLLSTKITAGACTAWDLLTVDAQHPAAQWALNTVDSVVAAITADAHDTLGCTDCEDTGFYGQSSADNEDLLIGMLRRVGDQAYESLQADGMWQTWEGTDDGAELLTLELAEDLAAALTAGAVGLLRKYGSPMAFLPPAEVVVASPLASLISTEEGDTPQSKWVNFAVVDDDDPGAVMQVVRASDTSMENWVDGSWEAWEAPDASLLAIPLDDELLAAITAGGYPKQQKCEYCAEQATQRIIHAEGMAYIPTCDEHLDKGKDAAAHSTPDGSEDPSNIDRVDAIVAYVSPDPRAERLRRYWSKGHKGGGKIRWMTGGDFRRCVRQLRKYLGVRTNGYCANMHKRNTGMWPGDRRNRGILRGSAEERLVASLQSGLWTGESERNSDMSVAELKDGIYCEVDDDVTAIMQTITAGGFPVSPPDEWYDNPNFTGPTPMQVDDDGRVSGHIATFDVTHIGMAGAVHAPKSKSHYAYFLTGALKTASGKQVNVGQLTLSGGHAPLHADAGAAVKHYDDTNSAVADVTVGEDRYGIWAAGSLRPNITPEQVRIFRASPLSGDWRPINGNLELVAACAVNVPGFPTARARVAGGAILALVAAGARPLAVRRASLTADAAVLERLDSLEARIPELNTLEVAEVEPVPTAVETEAPAAATTAASPAVRIMLDGVDVTAELVQEAVAAAEQETPEEVQPEASDKLDKDQVKQAREDAAAIRRDWLRREVHGDGVTAAIPETERQGIGGYPIKDEASLKDAIQAVGRAKPEDRAKTISHIKSAAAKLGLTKLLPKTVGW